MDELKRQEMAEALGRATALRHRIAISTGKIEQAARSMRDQSHANGTGAIGMASAGDTDEKKYLHDVISTGIANLTSSNPKT